MPPPPARRVDAFTATAIAVTFFLRIGAVVGLHPYRYVDSIDYDKLDFSGRGRRPWATPLLYWLAGDDANRVVLQATIGALCWTVLALEIAASLEHRWVRRTALVLVLALGTSTSITNWDTAMLSESLALSSTALLAAGLLHAVRRPSTRSAVAAALAALLWVFTRQNHVVLLGLLIGAVAAVLVVRRWRTGRWARPLGVLAAGLLVVAVLAAASYSRNTEIRRFNLAMVIGQRVVTDAERLDWFRDHGMPLPGAATPGEAVFPEPLLADEAFARWIDEDGSRTYARFLLSHPWYAVLEPLEDFVADRPSYADPPRVDETMLSTAEGYGSARQVIPEPLEEVVFEPGATGTVLVAIVVVLAATAHRWRTRGFDRRWLVPLLLVVLQWPALTVVWHASTAELGRLALVSAVALRIGLIAQGALLVDSWAGERRARPGDAAPAQRPPGRDPAAAPRV
jgi:hypothetical protein